MRELLDRWLLKNMLLKGVALVAAMVLFVVVRGEKEAVVGATIKVIYALPEDRVVISELVPQLRIRIRGPWTRLSHFDERDLEPIRVELGNLVGGELRFSGELVKLPTGLRLESITPATLPVVFERRQPNVH